MSKKLVVLTLASAFALSAALPASAADRQDKARRAPAAAQRPAVRPDIQVFGHGDPSKLRFHQRQTAIRPNEIFQKDECSFTCGDLIVTCSGASASCTGSSCEASGGGITLTARCVAS
ncbi:MAG TPA: hypothetical protein VIA62_04830 [Thermoanaerobaculia bacterium]|jgi:hypothetical protein|nr:hypothetical protein [Thermoanaerobaculia bacterium]